MLDKLDADGILGANQDIHSYNIYAYVSNNPINNNDPNGNWFFTAVKAIVITWTAVKVVANLAGRVFLRLKKDPIAKAMYNKSFYGDRSNISKSTQKSIENKIKNTNSFKENVKACIEENRGNNFTECLRKDAQFNENEDLVYALGHVDLYISGNRIDENTWSVTTNISDRYDFTKWEKNMKTTSAKANNLGFILQHLGMMRIYNWDISFSYTYEE